MTDQSDFKLVYNERGVRKMANDQYLSWTAAIDFFFFWTCSFLWKYIFPLPLSPVGQSVLLSIPKSQQSWVPIPASSDTVESKGRQIKQCWITYIKRKVPKKPFKKIKGGLFYNFAVRFSFLSFFCFLDLEQPVNSQTDLWAGMTVKPERLESQNRQKSRNDRVDPCGNILLRKHWTLRQ